MDYPLTEYTTKDSGSKDVFETGYQRDCSVGKGAYELLSPFAIKRLAQLYERGARKYGRNNWQKGAPFSRTMQSLLRHAFQYLGGDRSEDHLAAIMWNASALIHYEEMISRGIMHAELDDLPRYKEANNGQTEQYHQSATTYGGGVGFAQCTAPEGVDGCVDAHRFGLGRCSP